MPGPVIRGALLGGVVAGVVSLGVVGGAQAALGSPDPLFAHRAGSNWPVTVHVRPAQLAGRLPALAVSGSLDPSAPASSSDSPSPGSSGSSLSPSTVYETVSVTQTLSPTSAGLCLSPAASAWDSSPSLATSSSCDPGEQLTVLAGETARFRRGVVYGLALLLMVATAALVATVRT